MGKECFTCANKLSIDLTKEEGEKLRKETGRFSRPTLRFECKLTGKPISQIDPACDKYVANTEMVIIRKELSDIAKKLRKELNKK